MTKILASVPCTNCGKDHDAVIDLDSVPRVVSQKQEEQKPTVQIKEKVPGYIPRYQCVNGDCSQGRLHKNDNYQRPPKSKCTNCGQYSPFDANEKKCLWCNNADMEEIDNDDLEADGIELPAGMHTHDD